MSKEKINLVEILKGCEGTSLWSPLCGEVILNKVVDNNNHPIVICTSDAEYVALTSDGRYYEYYEDAECILYPSRECRDWSQFKKPLKLEVGKEYRTENGQWVKIVFIDGNRPASHFRYLGVRRVTEVDPSYYTGWYPENGKSNALGLTLVEEVTQ